jgi:hypothetical protein
MWIFRSRLNLGGLNRRKKIDHGLPLIPKRIGGQALVEFAIIVPVLVAFVVLAIEFGRGFILQTAVTNAAREGAYYLANTPNATNANLTTVVKNELGLIYSGISDPPSIQTSGCNPCRIYQPVTVTVNACGNGFVFINLLKDTTGCGSNAIRISASVTMMVVR